MYYVTEASMSTAQQHGVERELRELKITVRELRARDHDKAVGTLPIVAELTRRRLKMISPRLSPRYCIGTFKIVWMS